MSTYIKCLTPLNKMLFKSAKTVCFKDSRLPELHSVKYETHTVWYLFFPALETPPSTLRNDMDTVIFCHPITTNLISLYARAKALSESYPLRYYNMLAVEYPGFDTECDTTVANEYSFLSLYPLFVMKCMEKHGIEWKRSLLLAYSMGTTLAIYMASINHDVRAVVLLAAFSDIKDIIRDWMVGMHFFFLSRFPSKEWIKKVKAPIYLFHGSDDTTVPYGHACTLFENATSAQIKQLTVLYGLGHSDLCNGQQCVDTMSYIFNADYPLHRTRVRLI